MLLSRLLAGFTRGQSDTLRKAMGKKQIEKMNELEVLFYEGGAKNGHPKEVLSKIWEEWKKFASYAFNKSHAACYAWVAYQTAYLKAHYPAEYMAAVMTSAQTDIKRVTELMDDCRRMGLEVASPSVNDSEMDFSVDSEGRIRFGLQAISGMGEAASSTIIAEREKHGRYADIFDFLKRVDMHSVNRKNVEVLAKAGAFDGLGCHRAQLFHKEINVDAAPTSLDNLVRWAIKRQDASSSSQMSIFSMSDEVADEDHPPLPDCPPLSNIERCKYEKEVVNTYLSGHPLDDFKYESQLVANISVEELNNLDRLSGREVRFCGMVSGVKEMVSRSGEPFGIMTIDDYSGSYELRLFGDDYRDFRGFFINDTFVFARGVVTAHRYKDKKTGMADRVFIKLHINTMMGLESVLDRFTSCVSFSVNLADVTAELCLALQGIAKKCKGKVPLRATVVDNTSNPPISLLMSSDGLAVSPRKALPELEKLGVLHNLRPLMEP